MITSNQEITKSTPDAVGLPTFVYSDSSSFCQDPSTYTLYCGRKEYSEFTVEQQKALGKWLQQKKFNSITLYDNSPTDVSNKFLAVIAAIIKFAKAKRVSIITNSTNTSTINFHNLAMAATDGTEVQILNLSQSIVGLADAKALQKWLPLIQIPSLRVLELESNELSQREPTFWHGLFEGLAASNVEELDLNRNGLISSPAWHSIFDEMPKTRLRKLDLSSNDLCFFRPKSWEKLARMIILTKIKILDLSYNFLLNQNVELGLGSTMPADSCWPAFISNIADPTSELEELILNGNSLFRPGSWTAIHDAISNESNKQIHTLRLSDNDLDQALPAFWSIFSKVAQKLRIKTLDVSNNGLESMDEEKWNAFCLAIKNSKITLININDNYLSDVRKNELLRIISRNKLGDSSLGGTIFGILRQPEAHHFIDDNPQLDQYDQLPSDCRNKIAQTHDLLTENGFSGPALGK